MAQFSFKDRHQLIRQLREREFDVLIVGGGINGVGVLRDICLRSAASQRHFALIEKDHFATSASSKNSQLVHGGLRYLKYLDFPLVREALHERATLLHIAPHAVWKQSFLLPVYQWWRRWYYRLGVFLYDSLCGAERIGESAWLDAQKALQQEPHLNPRDLQGAVLFWDGQMHAPRLILDQLREITELGALAVNFVQGTEIVKESGRVVGLRVCDRLSAEEFIIRARVLVYTVGSWEKTAPLKLVRGSHLVFSSLTQGPHALAFFEQHGRILFVLPFGPERKFSLVGTTEKAQTQPEPVAMDEEEEEYLRKHVSRILPACASTQPRGHYSALRPLIASQSRSLSGISRRHQIWKSDSNVYHLAGGKWTTFRQMAQELVDLIAREHYPDLGPCKTASHPVDGNTRYILSDLKRQATQLGQTHHVPPETIDLLVGEYGRRALEILSLCSEEEYRRPLVPKAYPQELPYIAAQMRWAVESEMTGRLEDFLTISTPLGYLHRFSRLEKEKLQKQFENLLKG